MANTALMPGLESEVLNWSLRATAPSVRPGTFFLVFLTNSTSDSTITELAAGGTYTGLTGRPAFSGTAGQQFTAGAAGSNTASTAGATLSNAFPITFTATATHTGIIGIGISTSAAVGSPTGVQSEATLHYYGDLNGGAITLNAGQAITFAAGSIIVSVE